MSNEVCSNVATKSNNKLNTAEKFCFCAKTQFYCFTDNIALKHHFELMGTGRAETKVFACGLSHFVLLHFSVRSRGFNRHFRQCHSKAETKKLQHVTKIIYTSRN